MAGKMTAIRARNSDFKSDTRGSHKPMPSLKDVVAKLRPQTGQVLKRAAIGTWDDGFIYAGNLAYLAMLAIFPLFILGAALFELIGGAQNQLELINAVLAAMPPNVTEIIEPVARDTMAADSGWLLWIGAGVGLWTASGLIESIRDILRRAYGEPQVHAYWLMRLASAGVILAAVILMVVSLFAQVAIETLEEVFKNWSPDLAENLADLGLSRLITAFLLFISLYLLFWTLTPLRYRARKFPKWPGVVFTTGWWLFVTSAMPPMVSRIVTYDLIYGSLAGIMLVLFFFWLVGLGLVMGVELNAALAYFSGANVPDEMEKIGRAATGASTDEEEVA